MLISYKRSQGSVILRVKIRDSSVSTGAGLTGLTFSSASMVIATIADNEATTTRYRASSSEVETITTLGTYAAPTSGKCRFKEVDATNHPGVYEIHLADARFAVTSAKSLLVSISGATNMAQCDGLIPLTDTDPYDADALIDIADGVETGLTVRNTLRLLAAACAGKLSGAATTTVAIRNAVADSKDRITATVDSSGNRSAITTDLT